MGSDSTWVIDITISTLEALSEMQYHYINLRLTLHCTHTHTHNRLMAICLGLPGWAATRRNIHPLTPVLISESTFQVPT